MFPGHKQKITAIIEARMTSSRLPGKVLMQLAGEPALARLINRLRRSEYLDDVLVATTINREDDAIVDLCAQLNCSYFRGSEMDVLGRVLKAAIESDTDLIVEITGDCPLVDPRYVDKVIRLFYSGEYNYASNTIELTFPDGFDVRIFPTKVLVEVDSLTNAPIDRVHVSYFIYSHPEKYHLINLSAEQEMYWPELELVLDEIDDLKLLNRIFLELLPINENFSAEQVVRLLREKPELLDINAHVMRKKPEDG